MRGEKIIVIEHQEEHPTRWLLAEYEESYREAERSGLKLLISNVRDPRLQSLLSSKGIPWIWEHSWQVFDIPGTIVLDMWAPRDLTPEEALVGRVFIIGGIMGDHPPRGRGRHLSWSFDWSSKRKIGDIQMSINTTAWALARIIEGYSIEELPLCSQGANVKISSGLMSFEIYLPYAYPCDESGKPLIPRRIMEILSRGVVWEEEYLMA